MPRRTKSFRQREQQMLRREPEGSLVDPRIREKAEGEWTRWSQGGDGKGEVRDIRGSESVRSCRS